MRAVVLMSTHNGSAFVEPQLHSILQQDHEDIRLFVRDDGSTDGTPDILRSVAEDPRVQLLLGTRLGLPQAFFELMRIAPDDADAYLFSDQDDVWHRDKISVAARHLAELTDIRPALYFSRLNLVAHDLRPIAISPSWTYPPAFGNALIENICTGCTSAFNRSALDLLRMTTTTEGIIHHDWWLYLVASAFGETVFDQTSHIEYRIHGGNAVGLPDNPIENQFRRIMRAGPSRRFAALLHQAQAFARTYGDGLAPDNLGMLNRFLALAANRQAAFQLIADRTIRRQRQADDALWRLGLLLYGCGLIRTSNDRRAKPETAHRP